MRTLDLLLQDLGSTVDGEALLKNFVPPPRFAGKRFANYRPDPRFPSQENARERLRGVAAALQGRGNGWRGLLRRISGTRAEGGGVYVDGGFGVGKTHLLAALWHESPSPKAYLSFDELVYTIGLLGLGRTRELFRDHRLVAVDEWELDDPGNLKMALAFLRGALADGVTVATTSNTVPLELGEGRFSQKDFKAEIEELSGAFDVVGVRGEDYRHRHFEAHPGKEYFLSGDELETWADRLGSRAVAADFDALMKALAEVHPIRYTRIVERLDVLLVDGVGPLEELPAALRWTHFVDKLYDAGAVFSASARTTLAEIFPEPFLAGPYGKKFSRCLSRMEELFGESRRALEEVLASGAD